MEATGRDAPGKTRKRGLVGAAIALVSAALAGKDTVGTILSQTNADKQPKSAVSAAEPAQVTPPNELNPYKDLFASHSVIGKFMSLPKQENGVNAAKVVETPDLIEVSRFTYPVEFGRGKMTVRRYPLHNLPKGDEGAFEIDPKELNPQDFVLIRVSGSDYGYESADLRDENGKSLGRVSPWYMFAKKTREGPHPFIAVDIKTKEPLKPGELPYVISRNMFEPKQTPPSTPSPEVKK